ncbi:molybdopterin biosynthesis protein [Oceanirhabdus sp. W0125-5]|uniref:molybdopterin biosynthesis protein n=1 Tax=Oceanirhabdus sp. W0125-5 TaxID=2999116 RepID=UPI0022F2DEE6|nr:molybdopterin biosynthesis protein [Oceanirhabdus sp. W0125-5]WBW99505.1 molybdopterin biosynthesis protein [Oceanirhabdus sp. W0125-5]
MAQKVYLSNYELKDAIKMYFNKLTNLRKEKEMINTWDANGRVTSVPVYSLMSSPFYNSSAMDGIAVKSSSTIGATDRNQIVLEEGKDYIVVDTGDPIPKEFDSVIMIEDLINVDHNKVKIYKSVIPWQHIRALGEDIVENQLIIPSNHTIRPVDIGAMIAGGVNSVEVYKKPRVGIIPTGTEIVEPGTELKVGDIIEFNSRTFSAQVESWGGNANRYNIVDDVYEEIKETVKKASEENDIVLINAGSSAGREDYTAKVIEELGEVVLHGVAIKPGKPVILGIVNNKPVIGIPGYPVSAYFIMELIVKKLIQSYQGMEGKSLKTVKATLSRRVMSSLKHLEFVRMKLGYVGNKLIATPLTRGAGATMSLVRADGILEIPQSSEGIEAGEEIEVKLLKDEDDIKNTIVCIGSHDPIIDIVSDFIHMRNKNYFLSSAHVGSMGGIMALKKEETHIAPIHLLDMESGEYNVSYVKKYLSNQNIHLIKGVKRIQGLMVQKGNPLNIKGFKDIADGKKKFVNRQRGSGTRLLLDYNLKKIGINPNKILGYEREEFTHLSVAAAVAAGDVDCGLGVYSAAEMMELDFIPLCKEEYDIAVPEEYLEMDIIKEFIKVIKSEEFCNELDKLGGYDYSGIGEIIKIQ